MKSTLTIDELIQTHLWDLIYHDEMIPPGTTCACQDTEDNNETECYVYIPKDSEDDIPYLAKRIATHLGLPEDYRPMIDTERNDETVRLEFIVTICHRTHNNAEFI